MRVGERDVRGVDDFTYWLEEAGAGATVNFTVWRAALGQPLDVPVRLSASQNPARAKVEAEVREAMKAAFAEGVKARQAGMEARVAQTRFQTFLGELRRVRAEAQRLRRNATDADAARLRAMESRLKEVEARVAAEQASLAAAERRYADAVQRAALAETSAERTPRPFATFNPLLPFGLKSVGLNPRSAAKFKARGGLYVVSVRDGSPASSAGLLPGDVVETVNGRLLPDVRAGGSLTFAVSDELKLVVVRAGRRMTITLPPPPDVNEEELQ